MHARRRGLPVLLSLALTTGAVAVGSPARADDTAPTANYSLDSTAIWAGQLVRLTESGLTDDTTAPAAITRTVNWGDGVTETLAVGTSTFQHKYAAVGGFDVSVTLNDGALSGPGTFAAGHTVGVGNLPGNYAWQKSTIYTYGEYQEQGFAVTSAMPAESKIWASWSTGETSLFKSGTTGKLGHWFGLGNYSMAVSAENTHGESARRSLGPLTVAEDLVAPWISLTVPANPHAKASWGTIRGRTFDSMSGPAGAYLQLFAYTDTTAFYYDFVTKKWVVYKGGIPPQAAQAWTRADAAGNWSHAATGPNKGFTLEVHYLPEDNLGNTPANSSIATYKITS